MDSYLDIVLIPDAELPLNRLLNSVYTKLHKSLYDIGSSVIGVSFPKYNLTFGNVLRLHGCETDLANLQQQNWLGGMSGYCKLSEVLPVPSLVKFRTVSRKQTTMSQSKLKRLFKRGSITEDEAKNYTVKMFTKGLDNPYVELVSGSNGQRHRRYIEFGELQDTAVVGQFDCFGLSKSATVPWF